jgi:hypothetical protein
MANQLKMALIDTIHTLHRRGWSQRRIAVELDIDRATVARHLHGAATDPKPAIAPIGSEEISAESKAAIAPIGSDEVSADSKPAIALIGSASVADVGVVPIVTVRGPGRPSDCAPWQDVIRAKLDAGLTAQRIYQDLVSERPLPPMAWQRAGKPLETATSAPALLA